MEPELSLDQWKRISHVLDYIMSQPTGKPIKESRGVTSIRGEPEQPKRKPKQKKSKEPPAEQLKMF